ncbi:MAG: ATP-binding cassette domain-containing protein [Geminicoccaceae bacterium]
MGEQTARSGKLALLLEDLSYAYSRQARALDQVSVRIEPGSFTALLGPNGAGKTTLMALVTGLFRSSTGRIEICGLDLAKQTRPALASMGVVFQRLTLDLDLSVTQNLRYAACLYGLKRTDADKRIGDLLAQLNLADRSEASVRTLSGGLRRRVELARALLHEPRLLVLDEPTVGLDIDSRRAIVDDVHRRCRETGLAALWTTHLIDEIDADDQIVLLHRGRVRMAGTSSGLSERTGTPDLDGAYRHITSNPS